MRELRDQSGETVSLGILTGSEVVIIEKQESRLPVRIGVDVGLRLLLHDNAPGKAMIAFQQEQERERLLKKRLRSRQQRRTRSQIAGNCGGSASRSGNRDTP